MIQFKGINTPQLVLIVDDQEINRDVLGMILEDIMEKNFVTASMAYNRGYTIFVRRPISLVILVLTVLLLVSLMRMNKKIEALNQANIEAMAAEHAEMEKEEAEKKAEAEKEAEADQEAADESAEAEKPAEE